MITILSDFPIRPALYPAESLLGFVGRTFAANGHEIDRTDPVENLYVTLSRKPSSLHDQFRALGPHANTMSTIESVRIRFVRRAHKYCYQCMRELGYQLRTIDVAQSVFCPLHLVRLRSNCSTCLRRVTLNAITRQFCSCGSPLGLDATSATTDPVYAIWEAKIVETLSGTALPDRLKVALERCMPGWFRSITFFELERVLTQVASLIPRPNRDWPERPERAALARWPIAFHDTLRKAIRLDKNLRKPVIARSHLLERFPPIRRLGEDEDIPSEVRRRVFDFLNAHTLSMLTGPDDNPDWLVNPATAFAEYLPMQFVHSRILAEAMGWKHSTLRSVVCLLGLAVTNLDNHEMLFEQQVASEFASRFSGLILLRDAASSFCVSDSSFIKLLLRCGIQPNVLAVRLRENADSRELIFIPLSALNSFRRALFLRSQANDVCSARLWGKLSELSDTARRGTRRRQGQRVANSWNLTRIVASALASIIDGRLRAFCQSEPQGWCDILVDRARARIVLKSSLVRRSDNAKPSSSA